MKCKDCGGPVIQLFTGVACAQECDLHPYTEGDGSYEEYSAEDWDASDEQFIYPVYPGDRDTGTPTRVMAITKLGREVTISPGHDGYGRLTQFGGMIHEFDVGECFYPVGGGHLWQIEQIHHTPGLIVVREHEDTCTADQTEKLRLAGKIGKLYTARLVHGEIIVEESTSNHNPQDDDYQLTGQKWKFANEVGVVVMYYGNPDESE